MKHGKKPTVRQSKLIEKHGFSPFDWLVTKDTSTELWLVARSGGGLVITLEKRKGG